MWFSLTKYLGDLKIPISTDSSGLIFDANGEHESDGMAAFKL